MQVVVCESTRLFPKLIKIFTGDHATHVAFRYSLPEENWIAHSTVGGIQPDWWISFKRRYANMWVFDCLFPCADDAADLVVRELAGRGYDYLGLLGLGYYVVATRLGARPKRNPLDSKSKYMCTEFFWEWYQRCAEMDSSIPKDALGDVAMLYPGKVLSFLRSNTDLFKEVR